MSPHQPRQRQHDVAFLLEVLAVKPAGANIANLKEEVRQLVIQGLPHAFDDTKAARHRYQQEFCSLARNVLSDLEGVAVEQVTAADANVAEAQKEYNSAAAAVEEASAAVEASSADAKDKSDGHEKAVAAMRDAEQEQREAKEANEIVAERTRGIRAENEKACSVFEGPLRMLREGGGVDEDMLEECIEPVTEHLEARGNVEAALLAAAPLALRTQPDQRTQFDEVTLDAIVELFKADKADAVTSLEEGAPEETQASAEALGFWALAEVMRARAQESEGALAEAQHSAADAVAANENAKRKASECEGLLGSRAAKKVGRLSHREDVASALKAYERLLVADYSPTDAAEAQATDTLTEVAAAEAEQTSTEVETVLLVAETTAKLRLVEVPVAFSSPLLGA